MELLNSKVDHPGYQCDHTAWGVEVCERVDSPRVKLLYDIYHMQIMEGDVIRTIRDEHPAHRPLPHRRQSRPPRLRRHAGAQLPRHLPRPSPRRAYDLYVAHEFQPKGDAVEALRRAFETCDQS